LRPLRAAGAGAITSLASGGDAGGASGFGSADGSAAAAGVSTNGAGVGAGGSGTDAGRTTVAAGAGVVLMTAVAGSVIRVFNRGANALLVYPTSGAAIDALGANVGYSLPVLKSQTFTATSTTQWYSDNAPPNYN